MNSLELAAEKALNGDQTVSQSGHSGKLQVLFLVEGFTDIRFVTGLSEICNLTMVVPSKHYRESDLKNRVERTRCRVTVNEISGGRLKYQLGSLGFLLRYGWKFNVILAQEALRGALNAVLAGRTLRVPVVTCMNIAPVEYYRCRRERGQIGHFKAAAGEAVLRCLLVLNGRLCTRCTALGPYLMEVASRYSGRIANGRYYGVDTTLFRPASTAERIELRRRLHLPAGRFLVLLSSRISHEKDPETVLKAVAIARSKGLDAVVLNLGGGHHEFLELAHKMELPKTSDWVMARPAVDPMTEVFDYFRAADLLAQASLAEGAGLSPLEALACGVPVVATAVGGMARILPPYARLAPRRDANVMAEQILWVAANPGEAAAQAVLGREFVAREWSRDKAFAELATVLEEVSSRALRTTGLVESYHG